MIDLAAAGVQSRRSAPSGCGPVSASDLATALPTSAAASPAAAGDPATSDEQQARCADPLPALPLRIMLRNLQPPLSQHGMVTAKARLLHLLTTCNDH